MLKFLASLFPFDVTPSSPFCDVELGGLFRHGNEIYRLLYRDPWKVRIVRWNFWTRLLWGRK